MGKYAHILTSNNSKISETVNYSQYNGLYPVDVTQVASFYAREGLTVPIVMDATQYGIKYIKYYTIRADAPLGVALASRRSKQ